MRAAVRIAVTLCLVAVAIFAGWKLWQYYMLTPWTRDATVSYTHLTLPTKA